MAVANIKPIQDEEQYARILIHGESGIGKTTLAATSPKCLMLFNDVDQGRAAAHAGTKADRWVVQDYQDLTEAIEFLKHEKHDYEWVWLDNASIFQDQGMQMIMADVVMAKPHRSLWVPDKAEYMLSQQRLYYALTELKELPMNLGLCAHSMDMETTDDEGSDIIKVMPLFQGGRGAFSEKICGMFSVVGYYRLAKVKVPGTTDMTEVRQLLTNKVGRIYAKDRYGLIGNMQQPTMPKIIAKIGGTPPPPARKAGVAKKAPAAKKAAVAKKAPAAKKVAGAKKTAAKKAARPT